MKVNVLDHGHVALIRHMGDDETIVEAARNSISGKSVKATSDTENLIRYLFRHRHTTPFEAVTLTLEMKMPIFVARQFVRHRTQSINEMSARYGVMPEEYYVPHSDVINKQADKNKQGRSEALVEYCDTEVDIFSKEAAELYRSYERKLGDGMARELARINLPLSMYTQWHTTMNLHNAFHMLGLRMNPHAQYEARVYADAIYEILKATWPIATKAFEDYKLNAITLSQFDIDQIREVCGPFSGIATLISMLEKSTKREEVELREKLLRICNYAPSS